MIFEIPLALALSCLLAEVPAVHDACFAFPARLHSRLTRWIVRRRPQGGARIAAYAAAGGLAAVAALLSFVHPALRVLLLALALPMRTRLDEGLRVRVQLEAGDVPGAAACLREDAQTYEDVVRVVCAQISRDAAQVTACSTLALLGTPLRLGPALASAYIVAVCLAEESPVFARVRELGRRISEGILAMLCALCTALCGLEVDAAMSMLKTPRAGRLERVVLSAVGIGEKPTHDPLAGDLTQAAMLLWLALGAQILALTLLLLPLMR